MTDAVLYVNNHVRYRVLRRNSLTYLADPIFANDSSIGRVLDMGLNDIIDIDSEALNGLTSVNAV